MESWQNYLKSVFSRSSRQKAWIWTRQNLLSTWYNALLTLISLGIILAALGTWILTQAQWEVVTVNLCLIFVGRYPVEQLWRLWLVLMLWVFVIALSWGQCRPGGAEKVVRRLRGESALWGRSPSAIKA